MKPAAKENEAPFIFRFMGASSPTLKSGAAATQKETQLAVLSAENSLSLVAGVRRHKTLKPVQT